MEKAIWLETTKTFWQFQNFISTIVFKSTYLWKPTLSHKQSQFLWISMFHLWTLYDQHDTEAPTSQGLFSKSLLLSHPPGSCHCSKHDGFGFCPSLRSDILLPAVVLSRRHVSAEVFYLSSPMPEDNREEEHRVREMLHLQESPHTSWVKLHILRKVTWRRSARRGRGWPSHPQLLDISQSPVQRYNCSHQDSWWYHHYTLIIHTERYWNSLTHHLSHLTGQCNSDFQHILWASLAKSMITGCLLPHICHLKAPQPSTQHRPLDSPPYSIPEILSFS